MATKPSGKNLIARQSRRDFLKTSAVSAGALLLAGSRLPAAYAGGSDTIKVGLIGCGGRGTGAAINCLEANPTGVQITAMGDLFKDRLDGSHKKISGKFGSKDMFDVPAGRQFVGWDAYKKVIGSGVDMVILATPPAFRPMTLKAAVDAGKHVFMEKPVATDPAGIRSIIESSSNADAKKLAIVAGTQRRHEAIYVETMKRIHDGAHRRPRQRPVLLEPGPALGPQARARLERHGMAGPQLAVLHLAVRRPHRRAARP